MKRYSKSKKSLLTIVLVGMALSPALVLTACSTVSSSQMPFATAQAFNAGSVNDQDGSPLNFVNNNSNGLAYQTSYTNNGSGTIYDWSQKDDQEAATWNKLDNSYIKKSKANPDQDLKVSIKDTNGKETSFNLIDYQKFNQYANAYLITNIGQQIASFVTIMLSSALKGFKINLGDSAYWNNKDNFNWYPYTTDVTIEQQNDYAEFALALSNTINVGNSVIGFAPSKISFEINNNYLTGLTPTVDSIDNILAQPSNYADKLIPNFMNRQVGQEGSKQWSHYNDVYSNWTYMAYPVVLSNISITYNYHYNAKKNANKLQDDVLVKTIDELNKQINSSHAWGKFKFDGNNPASTLSFSLDLNGQDAITTNDPRLNGAINKGDVILFLQYYDSPNTYLKFSDASAPLDQWKQTTRYDDTNPNWKDDWSYYYQSTINNDSTEEEKAEDYANANTAAINAHSSADIIKEQMVSVSNIGESSWFFANFIKVNEKDNFRNEENTIDLASFFDNISGDGTKTTSSLQFKDWVNQADSNQAMIDYIKSIQEEKVNPEFWTTLNEILNHPITNNKEK